MDKQQKLQEWSARITDFKSSGLTMAAWCEANSQSIHKLKYWLRKLNESSTSTSSSSSSWLPLAIHHPSVEYSLPSTPLIVRVGLAGIEVKDGFNPHLLREIVRALEQPC